ncbi:MAG: protein kinase [Candidatus Zixiibacteriota bacterium]
MAQAPATKPAAPCIGEYEIIRKIGEGGLAEIFLARQKSLNRLIAIKALRKKISADHDLVRRFEREATTLAKMSHPNIVHVIDRGEDNGRLFFAMQFVDGTNFKDILHDSDWPTLKRLEVVVQVLKGLDYAHKNGIIHRDIKPANILIDPEDNALIADFGIALLLEIDLNERTETGVVMGTYAYMSPEQREDTGTVDQTTDIYATGVMLYEVLTGRKPEGRFKLPTELNPQLSTGYDEIVKKALQPDRRDRYQKAVEMKDALLAVMYHREKTGTTEPPSTKIKSFVGNCSFLDTLKDGVYSSTYLVEDRSTRALYVIRKQNKPDIGLRESKLLSNLSHPNILRVHGAGSDESKLVLVMDYAQGGSLSDRLVKLLEWQDARELMLQIARGMDFAHKNNIVHGNLKPANILFDRDDILKISDFALMANVERNAVNWYSAPERRKSKQADIYSAGIIFYQLLTNRVPTFDTHGRFMWIDSNRTTGEFQRRLVEKMIATSPTERFKSFSEIAEMLDSEDRSHKIHAAQRIDYSLDENARRLLLWGGLFVVTLILAALYFAGALG